MTPIQELAPEPAFLVNRPFDVQLNHVSNGDEDHAVKNTPALSDKISDASAPQFLKTSSFAAYMLRR
jgi:hypothetical protein